MNYQEYENKKRKCWEEFSGISQQYEAFSLAFDCAFAIGKEAAVITQKEIEIAAEEHAKDACYPAPDYGWYDSDDEQMREVLENTFKAGVNFALGKK